MSDYITTIPVVAGLTTIVLTASLFYVKSKAKETTEESPTVSVHEEVEELDKEVSSVTDVFCSIDSLLIVCNRNILEVTCQFTMGLKRVQLRALRAIFNERAKKRVSKSTSLI